MRTKTLITTLFVVVVGVKLMIINGESLIQGMTKLIIEVMGERVIVIIITMI